MDDNRRWSVAGIGIPLPLAAVIMVQTAGFVFWLGRSADKIDTVIEQNREIKAELYKQGDATRDLALRDDRIAELNRRVDLLERFIDGRRK
jgi:Tfp pilus assembly protein PilO